MINAMLAFMLGSLLFVLAWLDLLLVLSGVVNPSVPAKIFLVAVLLVGIWTMFFALLLGLNPGLPL